MINAIISIQFPITIIPTEMRITLIRNMFIENEQKLCEIQYEVVAGKWIKSESIESEDNQQILQNTLIDFITPVLFDNGRKIIPYQLYILIEQYRLTNDTNLLAVINTALQEFQFQYSLEGFVLQVSAIK